MSGINLRKFLSNFAQNSYTQQQTAFNAKAAQNVSAQISSQTPGKAAAAEIQNIPQDQSNIISQIRDFQLNTLRSLDRAVYAKEVFSFPKNINEFIYMLQRGLTQAQYNKMFESHILAQRNTLSQLQAQILAQLQGLGVSVDKQAVNIQLANQLQASLKNLDILSNGMINLNQVALLFQENGKQALTKLIMSMTEASKSGITDLSQMKEMAKLVNASIAIASENNPPKTLKLLLMLYLPWLPLEDGVGFDLEIQYKSEDSSESDSILVIMVTTINYGVVKATLILETSNSVQVNIECCNEFPKQELQLRIEGEQKFYAMDSVLSFTANENIKPQSFSQSANINMSKTTEINPYLLLMAHSIIKHIIDIDNNKTLGITSHSDKF